ncbi:transmembrane 4 L6 family member 5 isoform X1 [Zalophus californianus]|uniref:Transmembrane 4 L6 family member 5 isoform X1 n=1 Tax=Zalophus californianus TaxID=9704 RepID=A0A6J2FPY8_ZALCA|nr:transmembrane 4 L6 family member 5 isoform X1 [Zalophus californianus]
MQEITGSKPSAPPLGRNKMLPGTLCTTPGTQGGKDQESYRIPEMGEEPGAVQEIKTRAKARSLGCLPGAQPRSPDTPAPLILPAAEGTCTEPVLTSGAVSGHLSGSGRGQGLLWCRLLWKSLQDAALHLLLGLRGAGGHLLPLGIGSRPPNWTQMLNGPRVGLPLQRHQNRTLWNLCVEPPGVVSWNVTLFSLLVAASCLEIVLCGVQLVNATLGVFCGDCRKEGTPR